MSSLSATELDRALIRVGADRPWDDLELKHIHAALLQSYEDRSNPEVNDKYLLSRLVQGVHGSPDAAKLAWGPSQIPTLPDGQQLAGGVLPIHRKSLEAIEDMVHRGQMRLETKDALTTATTGVDAGGVLVNQTVIPTLETWFQANFKVLRLFPVDEVRGLDYEYNNMLTIGSAPGLGWVAEEGVPTEDMPTIFRGRANVGLLSWARRTTLRLELAVRSGGVLYTAAGMGGAMGAPEMQAMSATIRMARDAEITFLQGTTASGHGPYATPATQDEYGISAPNSGQNGLCVMTSGHANEVVTGAYPAGTLPNIYEVPTGNSIVAKLRQGITDIRNNGGNPDIVLVSESTAERIAVELFPQFRYTMPAPGQGVVAGPPYVTAIAHPGGDVPIYTAPDIGFNTYTAASIGTPTINGVTLPATTITGVGTPLVQDAYIITSSAVRRLFLGFDGIQPLEIPMGFAMNQVAGTDFFSRKLTLFQFLGWALTVPIYNAKIRVQVA